MAKKKKAKHKKKVHRHQPARSGGAANAAPVAATSATPTDGTAAPASVPAPIAAGPMPAPVGIQASRVSYVSGDVRRIGVLVVSCVAAELVLWYLFTYTGLGSAAYSLIK